MKKKMRLGAMLVVFCLIWSQVPVFGAQIDNEAVYPVSTNELSRWPQAADIYAETAVLMDADTGIVLFNKGMDELRYPASITKVMTALVALEHSSLDDQVVFTEACLADQTPDSQNIGMQVGEILTMRQCLSVMLIQSANDVATQIAVCVGGSVEAFAELMNQKAAELGCQHTHFTNASGLPDEEHYTTAYDMALIFQAALQYDTFREIIGTVGYTLEPTNLNPESRGYTSHDALLVPSAAQYYEGTIGGKTGYTEVSESTLVNAAARNNMTLIVVTMRADGGEVAQDNIDLFNYGFEHFSKVEVPGGSVILPEGISLDDLTITETEADGQTIQTYDLDGYVVGTGIKEEAEEEEPEPTITAAPTVEPQVNTEDKAQQELKMRNIYQIIIYILSGLIIITIVILLISCIVKSKKRRKAEKDK